MTGAVRRTLEQPGNEIVVGIRFSPSGTYVLVCTGTPQACDRTTLVWRTADGALVAELVGVAAVSGDDRTIAQWDAATDRIELFTAADLGTHRPPFRTIVIETASQFWASSRARARR